MLNPHSTPQAPLRQFKGNRVWLPLLCGGAIVLYVIWGEMSDQDFTLWNAVKEVEWNERVGLWVLAAVAMAVLREAAYIWQVRALSGHALGWRHSFQIVMLFEFFAAVTPTNIGGAALAVYILHKEGMSFGRSLAIILTVFLLALLYYVVSFPLLLEAVGYDAALGPVRGFNYGLVGTSIEVAFWIAYAYLAAQALVLGAGMFIWPVHTDRLAKRLFLTRWMRRWRHRGLRLCHDAKRASLELRDRSTAYWIEVWAATIIGWTARFLLLNCLVAAFASTPMGLDAHLLAFARHEVLYMAMMAAPTPGASGIAEVSFRLLFADLTPAGLTLTLGIVWRLISYYPFLLIGVPVMGRWLRRLHLEHAAAEAQREGAG